MVKKKKYIKNKKKGFYNQKLFNLILIVFRENYNKKLNYKQISKILNIKEVGVRMQVLSVMEKWQHLVF